MSAGLGNAAMAVGTGPAAGRHKGQWGDAVAVASGSPSSPSTSNVTPPVPAHTNCVRVG